MSDPSIIDPHLSKDHSFNASRASGSSYLQPDYKSVHGSILIGISHTENIDGSEDYQYVAHGCLFEFEADVSDALETVLVTRM